MKKVRSGFATTEFWVGLFGAMTIAASKQLWPDSPIPEIEGTALLTWVIARFGEKALSKDVGKRAWLTSEFWVAIGFSAVTTIFPELEGFEALVMAYIIGRPAVKIAKDTDLVGLVKGKG